MPVRASKSRVGTRVAPTPRTLAFDDDAELPVGATARERYPRERTLAVRRTGGELAHADISADDAEAAQADPVEAATARRLQARSHRHACDARDFEPAAARELGERQRQDRRR